MYHRFTAEEKEWLKDFIPGHSSVETAEALKEKFGVEVPPNSIRFYRRNHGIPCGLDGRFRKGHVPANKGKKFTAEEKANMSEAMRSTQFKKGIIPPNWVPVGTISVKGDAQFIKIKEPNKWMLMSRYVWQQAGRTLKKGEVLIHLNSDICDNRLENLEKVTRNELVRLNYNKLISKDPELTKLALTQIRLNQLIHEKGDRRCVDCIHYGGKNETGFRCNNPSYRPNKKFDMGKRCGGWTNGK